MASIDMKDAYYSIPIKREDRQYLRFNWEDQFYEFTCLPNGLSCAPPPPSSLKVWSPLKPPYTNKGIYLLHTWMTFIYRVGLMTIVSKML